ncbi:MAG: glutaredoxin [Pelodictyon luteolum]|uniref:Glutaredoxin n=1 Tax=Pelodictyon luteolum TaxID=1100 RepID=A0A165L703_PELLU|nr:glutaredoxin family protein [Pelodictyon luteolum]KZK73654.1 MAG: glutaredoxin [Pelodictyon luteolum]
MPRTVTIYGRPECCLCVEAMEVLLSVQKEVPFTIEKKDITLDPVLESRYRFSIPVIHIDGAFAFKHRVTAVDILSRLRD